MVCVVGGKWKQGHLESCIFGRTYIQRAYGDRKAFSGLFASEKTPIISGTRRLGIHGNREYYNFGGGQRLHVLQTLRYP